MKKSIQHEAVVRLCFDERRPALIYFDVLQRGGLRAARSINATLVLHGNAALMGLCYSTKSTGAAKRLPANPSDPLTTRHGFARAAEPAGRSCCQPCIIAASASDSFTAVCRIPPILSS